MVHTYVNKIESHFNKLIAAVVDPGLPLWPSAVNVETGKYPEGDHVPVRTYRLIGAPRGTTPYWDQPLILTAHMLSELTKNDSYSQAADDYLLSFLDNCIAPTGMFQWGNHIYYDVFENAIVEFHNGYHELRPITPDWDLLWRLAPDRTEAYIRYIGRTHVYDTDTGAFNRHDSANSVHAFLEAGGILAETLAWLYNETGDKSLAELALKIARFSFGHRNPNTDLVPNEPVFGRWDSKVCTSEIGLWAQSLLRAADYTTNDEFTHMAAKAVKAYLNHAFDETSGMYFGQVNISTGEPVEADEVGYWPRKYADPWNTDQWPTHDYPVNLAEACLTLHALTGDNFFAVHARQWANVIMQTAPQKTGKWAFAESYGRSIHFLLRAGKKLQNESMLAAARSMGDHAVDELYRNGLFMGYTDAGVYESVDGVGYLTLALIILGNGDIDSTGVFS